MGGRVELKVAESLPANDFTGNAFRDSYAYDAARGLLHVHIKRFGTYGDIALVLLHAISHVKANDQRDDANPQFIAEFHRNFKVVTQELVKIDAGLTGPGNSTGQPSNATSSASNGPSKERLLTVTGTTAKSDTLDVAADTGLNDRIKAYADACGQPELAEFTARYESSSTETSIKKSPQKTLQRDASGGSGRKESTVKLIQSKAQESHMQLEQQMDSAREKEKDDLRRRIEERKRARAKKQEQGASP